MDESLAWITKFGREYNGRKTIEEVLRMEKITQRKHAQFVPFT